MWNREVGFRFYVFTRLVPRMTTSGGSIFLLVKKDRGERHAKGLQSRPLESCFYTGEGGETCLLPTSSHWCILRDLGSSDGVPVVFALHGSAGKPSTAFLRQFHCRKHCFRRTLAYCTNCCEIVGTHRITNVLQTRQSGGCRSANHSTAAQHAEARE